MSKLAATAEITTAILSDKIESTDIALLARDPKNFIYSSYSIDMGDVELQVTHNDASTINLVLPYYSGVEQMTSETVTESNLDEVTGGEILIVALLAASVATSVAVVGASVGGVAALEAKEGKNLDGSKK